MAPNLSEIEVSLFGPGYGECIVVHLGAGDWMVVDSCHSPERKPLGLEYLKSLGVDVGSKIKAIVSTHWHDDHIRGLSEIVREAVSGEFYVSGAMGERQFLTLVEAMKSASALTATGVYEWTEILATFRNRKQSGVGYRPPRCIVGERLIYSRPESAADGIPGCEVWALSPSDESFYQARAEFEAILPKQGQAPVRLAPLKPNHTSVVLLIKSGEACVLLGADLENVGSVNAGWTAILNSGTRPQHRAKIFKIPHHGSANGHNDDVLAKMVEPAPVSLVSPFVHGKTVLPTVADIARIKGFSSACYVTTEPKLAKSRRKKSRIADRTMLLQVKDIQDVPFGTGHIQLRKRLGTNWQVKLDGSAKQI